MPKRFRRTTCFALALVIAFGTQILDAAPDFYGQVVLSGLPVPGATVTMSRGDVTRVTVTDSQGVYRFTGLSDGPWALQIEMLGFSTLRQDVLVAAGAPPVVLTLKLLPFETIASQGAQRVDVTPVPAAPARRAPVAQTPAPVSSGGFQRATVNAPAGGSNAGAESASAPTSNAGGAIAVGGSTDGDRSTDATDGLLINGSVNNGAASPFAQLAAFGNNRRGARSLYSGGVGLMLGNSAWAASPYSFAAEPAPKPDYNDAQIVGSFAGPMKIPGLKNKANVFLGFQHSADHNATTQSALMPTAAERRGDFSQTLDALGRPIRIVDPVTGVPFAAGQIPQVRVSSQAAALLGLFPSPNIDAGGRYNYQTPVLLTTRQDAFQSRVTETLDNKNQVYGSVSIQRTNTDAVNVFGFDDTTNVSGLDAPINWNHRFSQFLALRLRYQYTRLNTDVTPYFADRENVSGTAGIMGNNQDPVNWGPPSLIFSSGIAGLSMAQYASNHDTTHAGGMESLWSHGRHNVTAGGDLKVRRLDVVSQQNARGMFAFTGGATGSDLADFLLGLPHTSAIAFGNADKRLSASIADAYITDDLRLSPTFTANIGVRWEYEAPFTEASGRLVNLDVAPGFTAVRPVLASDPVGPLTGARYPSTLLRPDRRGFQPRLGVAWRPVAGSSLAIRGGYGIYRNTSIYQAMTMLLAQQAPLSTTLSVETSPDHPLTLANGFIAPASATLNTFAVDPNLRVGYAHNWQVLVQRDLPASLTITTTYLGTKGSHLLQEFLPNTRPLGAANPCPTCPAGFVYLASNGRSERHAGQVQLRRRLRNGLTASVQYTLAKATDDAAAAFTGATLNGAAIAQDWLNLEAEQAPSNFDQRHLLTAQFQYTSGVSVAGGTLIEGVRGSLLKGWTVTSQLTAGSGTPLTPIYLTSVPGTGVTGTLRPDYNGAADVAVSGAYANPAAYLAPTTGQWGTAGRNSIRGPAQFTLNASLGRSFLWSERVTLDWRLDATNVINHVTFTGVNTIVGSPQFGLPIQANTMRRVQSSLRVRF